MPQDIRISPDGRTFFVADMRAGGVFLIDAVAFTEVGFLETGVGTHGLYPSRDGTKLYVANRGSTHVHGRPRGPGSVTVLDFATRAIVTTWPIPGGGSPDMGNVSADGKTLWLSGRFDDEVYAIDTATGRVERIPVGREPHGLTVWPPESCARIADPGRATTLRRAPLAAGSIHRCNDVLPVADLPTSGFQVADEDVEEQKRPGLAEVRRA